MNEPFCSKRGFSFPRLFIVADVVMLVGTVIPLRINRNRFTKVSYCCAECVRYGCRCQHTHVGTHIERFYMTSAVTAALVAVALCGDYVRMGSTLAVWQTSINFALRLCAYKRTRGQGGSVGRLPNLLALVRHYSRLSLAADPINQPAPCVNSASVSK